MMEADEEFFEELDLINVCEGNKRGGDPGANLFKILEDFNNYFAEICRWMAKDSNGDPQ